MMSQLNAIKDKFLFRVFPSLRLVRIKARLNYINTTWGGSETWCFTTVSDVTNYIEEATLLIEDYVTSSFYYSDYIGRRNETGTMAFPSLEVFSEWMAALMSDGKTPNTERAGEVRLAIGKGLTQKVIIYKDYFRNKTCILEEITRLVEGLHKLIEFRKTTDPKAPDFTITERAIGVIFFDLIGLVRIIEIAINEPKH